jgi:hypothetical protein
MVGPGAGGAGESWPRLALPGLLVAALAASGGCRAVGATTATGIGADVAMGPPDAESDTRQAARAIAKELAGFFARQGWISQEQAERYRLIP